MFFIKKTNFVKNLYIYINQVCSEAALLVDKHNKTYIILDKNNTISLWGIGCTRKKHKLHPYTIVKSVFVKNAELFCFFENY